MLLFQKSILRDQIVTPSNLQQRRDIVLLVLLVDIVPLLVDNNWQASRSSDSMPRRSSQRRSVSEWRSDSVVSMGASESFIAHRSRRLSSRVAQLHAVQRPTYVSSLYEDLQWAYRELGVLEPSENLERLAILLHESLTHESRGFHGVAHVFEISASATPLQLLAAFSRDVIKGCDVLPTSLQEYVAGVVISGDDGIPIHLVQKMDSSRDRMVAAIFGFHPGDSLESLHQWKGGMDVFMSTIAASRLYADLSEAQLLQLMAILEATIPFRPSPEGQPTAQEALFQRISKVNQEYSIGLSEKELIDTVQQGADLLNRVVGNMVTDDLAIFLDHTWSLLPEENASLRRRSLVLLSEYLSALHGMSQFLAQLPPSAVYVTFRQVPVDREVAEFRRQLEVNLKLARLYLDARLLVAALVMAFALLTGGDGPKVLFFGDLPSVHKASRRLGEGLELPEDAGDCEGSVYEILRGNTPLDESTFDTRSAPLAAFVYRALGNEGLRSTLALAADEPMSAENARTLLERLPPSVLSTVAREIATIATSRRGRIQALLESLES